MHLEFASFWGDIASVETHIVPVQCLIRLQRGAGYRIIAGDIFSLHG